MQDHEGAMPAGSVLASQFRIIKRLGEGLNVEATAPDGIIEAVSVKNAKAFAFGTQWHPEFKAANNPDSVKLFTTFGDAVRAHARARGETHFVGRVA